MRASQQSSEARNMGLFIFSLKLLTLLEPVLSQAAIWAVIAALQIAQRMTRQLQQ